MPNSNRNDDDKDQRPATEGSGKVAQAHHSPGDQPPTQIHQGRRTPESRGDRDTHVGSGNQTQSRQGAAGGRGAG